MNRKIKSYVSFGFTLFFEIAIVFAVMLHYMVTCVREAPPKDLLIAAIGLMLVIFHYYSVIDTIRSHKCAVAIRKMVKSFNVKITFFKARESMAFIISPEIVSVSYALLLCLTEYVRAMSGVRPDAEILVVSFTDCMTAMILLLHKAKSEKADKLIRFAKRNRKNLSSIATSLIKGKMDIASAISLFNNAVDMIQGKEEKEAVDTAKIAKKARYQRRLRKR